MKLKIYSVILASMLFIANSAYAREVNLVGQWSSSEKDAGTFVWKDTGDFVWTDGEGVSTGVWVYNPKKSTVSMIIDPTKGADDIANVILSEDGKTVTLSFFQIGRKHQETPWVAKYTKK